MTEEPKIRTNDDLRVEDQQGLERDEECPSAKKQRLRISVACGNCKKRKKRCNGEKPCGPCAKHGWACVYTLPKPAGRPRFKGIKPTVVVPPTSRNNSHHSTASDNSSERNNRENQHNQSQTANGSLRQQQNEQAPSLPESTINTTTSSSLPQAASSANTTNTPSVNSLIGSYNSTETEDYTIHTNNNLGKDSRMLSYGHGDGRTHFIGESCTLSLLELVRQLFRQTAGQSRFTESPDRFVLIDGPDYKASTPVQLPPKTTADYLFSLFEQNIHCMMYVFDTILFQQEIDDVYNNPLTAQTPSLCRLYLVLAIGAAFDKNSDDSDSISRLLFESALFYVNELSSSNGEVWFVEAHLLTSAFYELCYKRNLSWIHLGLAFRHAQCLGIGSYYINRRFPTTVRRHRDALWKSLTIQEQLRSTFLGRPAMSCYVKTAHDPENPALSQFAQLCELLGDIRSSIYETDSVSSSTAQRLICRLKNWSASFEDLVCNGNNEKNAASLNNKKGLLGLSRELPWNKKFLLTLNLSYLHCIILLTRPFLFYVVAKKVKSQTGEVDPALSTFENLAQTCVQSSLTSIKLLSDFCSIGSYVQKSSLVIYYILTCGVMLLLDAFQKRTVEPRVSWAVNCSMEMLQKYADDGDKSAKRYYDILNEMRGAVSVQGSPSSQKIFSPQNSNLLEKSSNIPMPGDMLNSPSFNSISVSMPESNNSSPFDFGNLNIDEVVDSWDFTPLGPILGGGLDENGNNQSGNSNYNGVSEVWGRTSNSETPHLLQNFEPPEALLMESSIN